MSQSLPEQLGKSLPPALQERERAEHLLAGPLDLDLALLDLDDLQAWLTWSMAVEVERLKCS